MNQASRIIPSVSRLQPVLSGQTGPHHNGFARRHMRPAHTDQAVQQECSNKIKVLDSLDKILDNLVLIVYL